MKLIRRNLFTGVLETIEFEPDPPRTDLRRTSSGQTYTEAKPLRSWSTSVHPAQVRTMRRFLKRRGVRGVNIDNQGVVKFVSRSGRADYAKARGMRDGDGCYGDG